jgi:hypothetical protein
MQGERVAQQRGRRLHQIDVDPPAFADGGAGEQRRRDRLKPVQSGADVRQGRADPVRDAVRADIHRNETGKRLGDRVGTGALGVRAVLSEAADRQIDQSRVFAAQDVVAQAEPVHDSGAKSFDEDVGGRRHLARGLDRLALFEIQHEAALSAVVHGRQGGLAAIGRAEPARPVALRRFDFDDVGAVGGEEISRIGRRHALTEIENAQSTEGSFVAWLERFRHGGLFRYQHDLSDDVAAFYAVPPAWSIEIEEQGHRSGR